MQIYATRGLQYSAQLHQARGHHGQVGQHIAFADQRPERAQGVAGPAASLHRFEVGPPGRIVPMPRVVKGLDLGGRLGTPLAAEQDVVAGVGVEGRVKVDEVYRLVFYVAAQNVQVVAVVQGVHRIPSVGIDRDRLPPVRPRLPPLSARLSP